MASSETKVAGEEAQVGQAGTVADGSADQGADVFPPFDSSTFPSQLLWLAITFVALYFLMARVALPRIAGILENRRDRIASDLDSAERLKGESEQAIAVYEAALAEARGNASGIAETAREGARQAADAKRSALESDLAGQLADAETRIGDIKTEALREVGSIASEAAATIVTKLTDLETTPVEIEEAITRVMKEGQDNAV